MAIAKLNRAVLLCPKSELALMLTRLCRFSFFHPSDREGLIEHPQLLMLVSRIHAIYSEANELLANAIIEEEGRTFEARDLPDLVEVLSEELIEIKQRLQTEEKSEIYPQLVAIRDAAQLAFNNLRRIRVYPDFRRFVIIEGFIPSDMAQDLTKQMQSYIIDIEPVEKRLAREPYIPSLIVNPKIVSLFENITLAQGLPRYNEIDPTPIIAFVFPIFFGMMLADMGRGLILLAVGLLMASRMKGKYGNWGRMIAILGTSASIFGFLRGEFFGLPITPLQTLPFRFDVEAPTALFLLEVAVVLGTFHLATAYALAILGNVRSRNYIEAFLGHLPTLLFYSSSIAFFLAVIGNEFQLQNLFSNNFPAPLFRKFLGLNIPVYLLALISFPIVAVSFLVMVFGRALGYFFTHGRRKDIVHALQSGLLEGLLKPIEFFTNTISYARLGALLIISSILGTLTRRILEIGLLGIPLFAIANIALISIEGFIVYVQDLRLHLYEWMTKFYFGLGIPFSALTSKSGACEIRWSEIDN